MATQCTREGVCHTAPFPARKSLVCDVGLDVHRMQVTVSVRLRPPSGGEPQVETQTFGPGSDLDEMASRRRSTVLMSR